MSAQAEAALAAATLALTGNPRDLAALLSKGRALQALGREREALAAFEGALAVAPPFHAVLPELRPEVRHAFEVAKAWHTARDAFLQSRLETHLGGRAANRFRQSIEVLSGERTIYRQQPVQYYFPEIPCIEFFDPEAFPWLADVVAESEAIRDEFLAVVAEDAGFEPYIAYPEGSPLDQWRELNHNPRWSAFHLLKDGRRVDANADRCPATLAVLSGVPQPHLPGRMPTAMFSLLKPRTRIPPHTGVTNARIVVHVPLVVPPGCRYRVGGSWREWRVGEALVFDDSIEHEAWNDGDAPRAVLIFDIWNPALTDAEREAVVALYEGLDAFSGAPEAGWS